MPHWRTTCMISGLFRSCTRFHGLNVSRRSFSDDARFLTCFAHVFSLERIFYVWDRIMQHNSSLTICVGLCLVACEQYELTITGVSILMQMRTILLSAQFNECILMFSDSPDVVSVKTIQLHSG